ncbi:alpha/beta-hydrolase [Peniophora sp. CONT]|nr:alpha/beta-hydrolase [Peniophora sp. CONT]
MRLCCLPVSLLALCAAVVEALPQQQVLVPPLPPQPRPLVIWHGMGDSYSAPGMVEFMDEIRKIHPGIFIHSVFLDEDNSKDRQAGLYGNVNEQVAFVAEQLANVTELAGGFDAIGFSQGGQFLRAYVERYNEPRMHNLVTFGSQHMGISDVPACRPLDFACRVARAEVKRGVYRAWAQEHIVQAQYYRDPEQMDLYLSSNKFLTSINNEIEDEHNATYASNFASLDNLVLVIFAKDKTVIPKESAWFGSYAPQSEGDLTLVPMRLQPLYTDDWIGLRSLDERGAVQLVSCPGEHMQLARECWEPLVRQYAGAIVEQKIVV